MNDACHGSASRGTLLQPLKPEQRGQRVLAALDAGKHVFLEKPMASTVADCRKIIAAAKRSKGILQIGHICRFNPRYRMAKQAIDDTHKAAEQALSDATGGLIEKKETPEKDAEKSESSSKTI